MISIDTPKAREISSDRNIELPKPLEVFGIP